MSVEEPFDHQALRRWMKERVRDGRSRLGHGYQSEVFLYPDGRVPLIIKAATGWGPAGWLRRAMLRREHRIYRHLDGAPGTSRCFGLLDGRYLVLEHVDGELYRWAAIDDREGLFRSLLELIHGLHARGIAHGDLNRKDNLIVTADGRPCLLDFGTAVWAPEGAGALRRWVFRFIRQLDHNAWVKLKYERDLSAASAEDLALYHDTVLEKIARAVKRVAQRIHHPLGVPPKEHRRPQTPL